MTSDMQLENSNDNCRCCEGIHKLTPAKIRNVPGQSSISYRVGTYNDFKESMFVQLSSNKVLSQLTTRDSSSDLAIALLDSCAVIGDVLTFYQERIANEGFLRTATERRSILELASEIGYQLRPGVAASTFLAFSLEEDTVQRRKTVINIGTKVQSLPGDSEIPQIFETIEKLEARSEWSSIKPGIFTKQQIGISSKIIYLQDINTQLKPGDGILVVKKDIFDGKASVELSFRIVSQVKADIEKSMSRVELVGDVYGPDRFNDDTETRIYAFRIKAGIFGNNAPNYDTMPDSITKVYPNWDWPPLAVNMRRKPIFDLTDFEFTSAPAVISHGGGEIDIFIRGQNNSLLHRHFDGTFWKKWESLGGGIISAPSAVAWPSGRIDVFAQGEKDDLCHKIFDSGWSEWESLGGKLTSSPAAIYASEGGGRMDVFVKGTENAIWHKWYNDAEKWGSPETHWESMGGVLDSAPAVVAWPSGELFVFAVSPDRYLYLKYSKFNDGFPSGIEILSTSWSAINKDTKLYSNPSVLSLGSETLGVYAKSRDGNLLKLQFIRDVTATSLDDPLNFTPFYDPLAHNLASSPAATYLGDRMEDIFFLDKENSLSYKWYDEGDGKWGGSIEDHVITLDPGIPEIEFEDVYYSEDGKLIYLDNSYSTVVPTSKSIESWIVLEDPDLEDVVISKIKRSREETLVDFASTTKVTGLDLDIENGSDISNFKMRKTSVYVQSEELILAQVPIDEPIEKEKVITLNTEISFLQIGQNIAITGEIIDDKKTTTANIKSEILVIAEIGLDKGRTKLTFRDKLKNSYKRDTITLNANVAEATHGETKQVLLGGGNPSQYLQHFILKEKPLTYISAPTISGIKSTLEIRVDNIIWEDSASLYSLTSSDRGYTSQTDNELQTHIFFGDGFRGLRPNAGLDNITAKYRIGIGNGGLLNAGQLNILMDMPLGVRGVINPVPSSGAADPENLESARQNAPLTVLTMDRIVSLTDYENFAKAFQGIGKAHAIWTWEGEKRIVYLTISSKGGTVVEKGSRLYQKLTEALNKYKDPVTKFKIGAPEFRTFNLKAGISILDGHEFENVKLNVQETLKHELSFEARQFGQQVTLSEVISIIQNVNGVNAVKIELLYLTNDAAPTCQKLIPSQVAHWDNLGKKTVSSEMIILNSSKSDGDAGVRRGLEITQMWMAE